MATIDWDKRHVNTCYCKCGAVFRSKSVTTYSDKLIMKSQVPCPSCGKDDNLRGISHDPEKFTIG